MQNKRNVIKRILFFIAYLLHHNHKSKVIYYHDVGTKYTEMGTDVDLIQHHIDIIRKSGYKIVPSITKEKGEVMICFDDGWAGIYDYKDEFVRQQIFPTIFIAVNLIGTKGYLTKSQIETLKSIGFQFEAHSWSHQDLTTFDDKELEHELKDSKKWLEEKFNHPFDAICFPMGRFSSLVKKKSLEFGYTDLYSSLPGAYYDMKDDKLICRNCAQNSSLSELKWMLNGTSWIFMRKLYGQHFVKE